MHWGPKTDEVIENVAGWQATGRSNFSMLLAAARILKCTQGGGSDQPTLDHDLNRLRLGPAACGEMGTSCFRRSWWLVFIYRTAHGIIRVTIIPKIWVRDTVVRTISY